jgi:Flp pilus assembly pilin Flp
LTTPDRELKGAIAATRFGLGAKPGEIAEAARDPGGWLKAQIRREDHGQDLIEYALIVALITLAAIIGIDAVGTKIQAIWTDIAGHLTVAAAG